MRDGLKSGEKTQNAEIMLTIEMQTVFMCTRGTSHICSPKVLITGPSRMLTLSNMNGVAASVETAADNGTVFCACTECHSTLLLAVAKKVPLGLKKPRSLAIPPPLVA